MLNKPLFLKNFGALCELFDKQVSDTLTAIYYESLKKMTDQEFKAAVSKITETSKFFPKPADFLESTRIDSESQAIMAYDLAVRAGRTHGSYQSVKFEDPAIHSTIDLMGGWQKFCTSDDDRKWQQKEFEKIYKAMRQRADHPDYLPGIMEAQNTLRGYLPCEPILILGNQNHNDIKALNKKEEL